MNIKGLLGISVVCASLFFGSCQKVDEPVRLPAKGDAEYAIVEMGEDYVYQLFFDLETASIVKVSEINGWDLAFETTPEGFHVFMNGGADVKVYNTHETNITKVNTAPEDYSADWLFDAPCLIADSTAIGDWTDGKGLAKNEVYIVRQNPTDNPNNLKKISLVSVNSEEYVMTYADLKESVTKTVRIKKDDAYSYVYFSFRDGGKIVQPDPPKNQWDIVFTRFRHIYYDLDNYPYIVTGALLNPYNTLGYHDSTLSYDAITGEDVFNYEYTNHRNVIGFGWKEYDFDTERYEVNKEKAYIIKNRNEEYWKIHFLDFYDRNNLKGSPSFEFERMY